ncbi:MAG: hypothetical protein IPP35_10975 [Elusimicrobia bacterium]|nr:hypothetical protein [Elusimicrobiota bacterium]
MIPLEFTETEFRELLEVMYLADWATNAHRVPDGKPDPYHALQQKILGHAKAAGCGDLVVYSEKEKAFAPSDKLEKTCHGTLDVYDEETFWEELVRRLALRDIEQERGPDALEKMSAEIRSSVISEIEERYQTECERHGLDRLEVVEE